MKKILIIEDDVKAGEIYTQALQRAGFSCSVVTSADEGVTEIKNNHPDLVLLDIMLPGGKNGFDVLEHLKRDDKTKDIPVIVLTNLDAAEAITKEQVEPRKRRIFVRSDILAKGDDRGQLQRSRWAVHLAVVMGDDIHPLEEHRLDRRLPWPKGQWIIAERRIIGVEHQCGTTVWVSDEIGMIHGAKVSSVRKNSQEPRTPRLRPSRTIPQLAGLAEPWRETGGTRPVFPSATPDANPR